MTQNEVDWERVYRQNYESRAFWDIHWTRKANDLISSAIILEPELLKQWNNFQAAIKEKLPLTPPNALHNTYFMILSFAIENLLKASIIRQHGQEMKEAFRTDSKFPKILKGHNLAQLAKTAKFKTTKQNEDLLRRLARCAIWFGRYPVPLDYKNKSGVEKFDDGNLYFVSWVNRDDIRRAHILINDIKTFLDT